MKKNQIIWVILVSFVFPSVALACGGGFTTQPPKGLIPLMSLKINSNQTLGSTWYQETDLQKLVCKAEKLFDGSETLHKVVFYPYYFGFSSYVSKDVVCELTKSSKGPGFIQKYTHEPFLYREIASNVYDEFLNLIFPTQVRSFSTSNPNLVCKTNKVGVVSYTNNSNEVYNKVIFSPFESRNLGRPYFTSRDLTCSTNPVVIGQWKRNPYWKDIVLK